MDHRVRQAISDWDNEVDEEIIRLIEAGVPPYDAAIKARNIVSERRSRKKLVEQFDIGG